MSEGTSEPKQIFVLGRNRSGTKWLTNQVSNHPQVAAITAPETGVLEANIFEHLPRMFGDLSIDDHYYAFLAAFAKSSFFARSGLPESVLFEQRHERYLDLFAFMMDRLADERRCDYWLQKGSSLMLPELMRRFPAAKFLIMRRIDVLANVSSSIALKRANSAKQDKPRLLAREVASYYLHRATEQQYRGRANCHFVEYESMRADKEQVMRAACQFIGLEFSPEVLVDAFPPNTSFRRRRRDEVLTSNDLRFFKVADAVLKRMPLAVLRRVYEGRLRRPPRKGERLLIAGAFKTFRRDIEERYVAVPEVQAETDAIRVES